MRMHKIKTDKGIPVGYIEESTLARLRNLDRTLLRVKGCDFVVTRPVVYGDACMQVFLYQGYVIHAIAH